MTEHETKKLGVEDLAKRVAPVGTPVYQELPTDPVIDTTSCGGGGAGAGELGSSPVVEPGHPKPHKKLHD